MSGGGWPADSYRQYILDSTRPLRCRRTRFGPIVVWVVDASEDAEPVVAERFSPVIVLWGSETRARRRAHRRWRAHLRRVRADLARGADSVEDAVHRIARHPRHE
jgi:hypothetical protein